MFVSTLWASTQIPIFTGEMAIWWSRFENPEHPPQLRLISPEWLYHSTRKFSFADWLLQLKVAQSETVPPAIFIREGTGSPFQSVVASSGESWRPAGYWLLLVSDRLLWRTSSSVRSRSKFWSSRKWHSQHRTKSESRVLWSFYRRRCNWRLPRQPKFRSGIGWRKAGRTQSRRRSAGKSRLRRRGQDQFSQLTVLSNSFLEKQ